jgi:hypothetical protein
MTKQADDLEAVRAVVQTLEPFQNDDRERIIRWAREKLAMPAAASPEVSAPPHAPPHVPTGTQHSHPSATARDIRSFVQEKKPKTDQQTAAVVAYYYEFVAPESEKKDSIGADDLKDACRKADWKRPAAPLQTLINASNSGLLDKATEKGRYRLNSVGENLVAMVLGKDEKTTEPARAAIRRKRPRKTAKKTK